MEAVRPSLEISEADEVLLARVASGDQAAFEKLSKHQPELYARWGPMRKMSLERLRMLLLTARASASALGLPGEGQ